MNKIKLPILTSAEKTRLIVYLEIEEKRIKNENADRRSRRSDQFGRNRRN